MAPIRRYLRITRYSVLEVRIYLDNPALANSWLLNPRDPVLPRVIEAVRPLVLPKLREENENAKKKSGKKKKKRGVRDVVTEDDFEVSIFLTETSTQHALLTKQKDFTEKPKLKSNSGKLTGYFNNTDNPINVEDEGDAPLVMREEDDEEDVKLADIPEAGSGLETGRKRGRDADNDPIDVDADGEPSPAAEEAQANVPRRKRNKVTDVESLEMGNDDKKKLAMKTAYEGFSIYGRILCLIVKRRGVKKPSAGPAGGSQMLENWVSTQAQNEAMLDDAEDGGG